MTINMYNIYIIKYGVSRRTHLKQISDEIHPSFTCGGIFKYILKSYKYSLFVVMSNFSTKSRLFSNNLTWKHVKETLNASSQ